MDILNDDCLILIFKLLNLKDQISVARAYHRFRHVLSDLWQTAYYNLSLNFEIEDITVKDFAVLIEGISCKVQQMRLRGLTVPRFNVLKLYKFPNLTSFSFTQWSRSQLSDFDVLDMTKLFPKLISFSPHGTFSGMHMENLQHLQFLNLTYCAKLKFSHFETIFEQLHLKSVELNVFFLHYEWTSERGFKHFTELESIFLNTNELTWLLKLSKFIKLKELTIADRDAKGVLQEFLKNLKEHKCNNLVELETVMSFPFLGPQTTVFQNLRKLILVSNEISAYINIFKYTNLREVVFKCCDISSPEDFIVLLEQSVQMEYISVEQCNCRFRDLSLDTKIVIKHRTKRLHFNFYENSYTDRNNPVFLRQFTVVTLTIQGSSDLLEITKDISTPVTFQPLRMQFQYD